MNNYEFNLFTVWNVSDCPKIRYQPRSLHIICVLGLNHTIMVKSNKNENISPKSYTLTVWKSNYRY